MPNSDANITRSELVTLSFDRIGVTNPSNEDNARAVKLLNLKLRELDELGEWAWAVSNTPTTLTLVSSQRAYATGATATTIATNILQLERVEIVQGTTLRPLRIISKPESISTWARENTAEPTDVFLEVAPLMTSQKMHFLPTPNAAYSVQYYFRRRLYDFDLASDNPDMPPGWGLKLVKILADELAPFYVPQAEWAGHRVDANDAIQKGRAANEGKSDPTPQRAVYF